MTITIQQVRQAALNLLARREHSRLELLRKLRSKGFSESIIDGILDGLIQQRLLSDDRFTEIYIRTRTERGWGALCIQAELLERGVDEDVIDRHFNNCGADWQSLAEQARLKRFGSELPKNFPQHGKQARFLQRRGFSNQQIHNVLGRDYHNGKEE